MSKDEFDELMCRHVFAAGPNSTEDGKWFAESAQSAIRWGEWLYGSTKFYVIEVQFQPGQIEQFERWPNLDDCGPARYAELEALNSTKQNIRKWTI